MHIYYVRTHRHPKEQKSKEVKAQKRLSWVSADYDHYWYFSLADNNNNFHPVPAFIASRTYKSSSVRAAAAAATSRRRHKTKENMQKDINTRIRCYTSSLSLARASRCISFTLVDGYCLGMRKRHYTQHHSHTHTPLIYDNNNNNKSLHVHHIWLNVSRNDMCGTMTTTMKMRKKKRMDDQQHRMCVLMIEGIIHSNVKKQTTKRPTNQRTKQLGYVCVCVCAHPNQMWMCMRARVCVSLGIARSSQYIRLYDG